MKSKRYTSISWIAVGLLLVGLGLLFFYGPIAKDKLFKENNKIAVPTSEESDSKKSTNKYVGIWHVLPMMPSGWADHYHFFEDGKFRMDFNQMDGEKRVIDISGVWKVENNQLELTITDKTIITGGRFVESMGSIATKYVIEDGKIEKKKVNPAEVVKYELGEIFSDLIEESDSKYSILCMKINGKNFWKMYDDPYQD